MSGFKLSSIFRKNREAERFNRLTKAFAAIDELMKNKALRVNGNKFYILDEFWKAEANDRVWRTNVARNFLQYCLFNEEAARTKEVMKLREKELMVSRSLEKLNPETKAFEERMEKLNKLIDQQAELEKRQMSNTVEIYSLEGDPIGSFTEKKGFSKGGLKVSE